MNAATVKRIRNDHLNDKKRNSLSKDGRLLPQLKGSISSHLPWLWFFFLFFFFKIFMYVDVLSAHVHVREHLIQRDYSL